MDDKSNDSILSETNSADEASEHGFTSEGETGSESSFDDYPAFSPEGMVSWMFERCNRRFEDAMIAGNREKAEGYNVRRALLVDFMQYLRGASDEQCEMAT